MKKRILFSIFLAAVLFAACSSAESVDSTVPETTLPATTCPEPSATLPPETEQTLPPIVLELTDEETEMLLKIGMAELGDAKCETCIAMVMCTVLNRVNADGFGRSVSGVLHAQGQFTPVMDGSYYNAEPNEACYTALDMVIRGWDESQGALYYEWCEGESWHSRNLELLLQHCDTRFYK